MSNQLIPVKKNDIVTLTINDIGTEGQGIGRYEGYTLFVDGALPTEEVQVSVIKVGKTFGIGKLLEIVSPSPDRVEPICPIARQCGGCSLQHFDYQAQRLYKQNKVAQLLTRIGKIQGIEVFPTIGMEVPYHYRNKVQYPVRDVHGEIKIGYYAKRSHRIVETETCFIQDRRNEEIRHIVLEWMKDNAISAYNEEQHKGLVRHIVTRHSNTTGLMHMTLVINGRRATSVDKLIEMLQGCGYVSGMALNINRDKTNVIMGSEMVHLFGKNHVEDMIGDVKFQISPKSFFQVNPVQTEKLYSKTLEYAALTGKETVLDLYCGIGSISLFLAKRARKVIGVEIVEAAVADAIHNAELNQITNAEFYTGKVEEVIPRLYKEQGIKADVIVVDPPRKGCDSALLETIIKIAPSRVVYVSCDPSTLARDVNFLTEHGYVVEKVQPVDMFPMGTHVETVCLLQNKSK